ncbi:hypothetical protein CRE_05891 [Caenorhabditis remanei]|uniref:Domain of unknown function WSN domain-containing protein n=1 Tax=Caenorhabditis remanei TaxID=31234 RepID=E3MNM3_CAERE|nr:hypothetical protein CRE_05891 [Caenorhabditis remanei]
MSGIMHWVFILAVTLIPATAQNSPLSDTSNSHYYPSVTDGKSQNEKIELLIDFQSLYHTSLMVTISVTVVIVMVSTVSLDYLFYRSIFLPDDFSATVDQILRISRVINGIALQQGLMKQSIPSDTLITELLNLGSVTPALIQDLKPDEIAALVEEIQSFPKNLIQSVQMDIIEQRFLMYSSMVNKIKGVEKNFGIPKSDQYLTDVKKLAGTTKKLTDLDDGVTFMKSTLGALVDLETYKGSGAKILMKFGGVTLATGGIKSLDQFKSLFDSKVIGGAIFDTLTRVQSTVQEFEDSKAEVNQYDTKDDSVAEQIGENIKKLNSLAGKAKSALPTFHNLKQLFIHRFHRSGNRELTLSSGFPNGFSDLQLISDDLMDPWVQSVVDEQSESLAEAMEQLKLFGKAIGSMDGSFSFPPGGDQVLRDVYERAAQLAEISEKFGGLDEKEMKKFKIDVRKSQMKPSNLDKFNNLMEKINLLGDQYQATLKVIDLAAKLTGDNNDDLSKMLKIIANSNTKTAPTQLKTLRESLEFKTILDLLRGAEKELNTLQNQNSTVIDLAKTIGEEYGEVKTYMDELGGFFDGVDQIRHLKGVDVLGEVIEAIKMFRGYNESALSFGKIKEAIPSVQQKMVDLQVAMGILKVADSLEVNALAGLQDVLQDSQTIGSASRIFWSIKKVDKVVVLGQETVKIIQDKIKGVDQDDQKNFDQLLLIDNQLTTVYAQIDGVKKNPMDFLEIGKTVEKLTKDITLTPEQLKSLLEVKRNLETLDTLGLDYARRHKDIDESKKALDQMDLFFADFKIKVTPVTTTSMIPPPTSSTPPLGQLQSNASTGALGGNGESKEEGGNWIEE